MMYRTHLYSLAVFTLLVAMASAASLCTGYPKMYNGLPCASTTRYWDGQMGACGCGTGNTNPFSWQWNKLTAAASPPVFGSGTWCGSGCGKCFKLTPTGVGAAPVDASASAMGRGAVNTNSVVLKVTNLCPPQGNANWCSYDVNDYGYDAHFDIMDYNMNGLVSAMGWDNPEVTYEEVSCEASGYTDWNCQCANNDNSTASTTTSTTTTTTTTTTTKAPAKPQTTTSTTTTQAPAKPQVTTSTTTTQAPAKPQVTTSTTTTTQSPAKTQVTTTTTTKSPVAPPASSNGQSVKIQVSGGVNVWWFGFSVVGNAAFSKIELMDTNGSVKSWSSMSYQGGANWNLWSFNPTGPMTAPLSLRFTSTSGTVLTASNIVPTIGGGLVDTLLTF